MNKKYILAFLFFAFSFSTLFSQKVIFGQHAKYIDGLWGSPQPCFIAGSYDDLIIISGQSTHPSNYYFRVKIDDFYIPTSRSSKRKRIKSEESYNFNGTVEYFEYVGNNPGVFITFNERIKSDIGIGFFAPSAWDIKEPGVVSVKRPAKISINPYKDNPEVYNVSFENYGIAFIRVPMFSY